MDLDDEPTMFDRRPWHLGPDARLEDSVTAIRPPPRCTTALALRPVRPAATASVSEKVEQLSLPPGLREDMLTEGTRPRDHDQVHIAIVRVSRQLGREYRERRGCLLRTDAAAIEVLQRHLTHCASEVLAGRVEPRTLAPELARHGGLFGEILARRLGGTWLDLTVAQPSHWQMALPSGDLVMPIARVHRFLLQRNREQDLVGFFLDLDAAVRRSA
jgi:hypothetical protein